MSLNKSARPDRFTTGWFIVNTLMSLNTWRLVHECNIIYIGKTVLQQPFISLKANERLLLLWTYTELATDANMLYISRFTATSLVQQSTIELTGQKIEMTSNNIREAPSSLKNELTAPIDMSQHRWTTQL